VARCNAERLIGKKGLPGVRRGNRTRTTTPDTLAPCPLDRDNRHFKAIRPNELRVTDFTYVSTSQGWLLVTLFIEVFARSIVGWWVSHSMRIDFLQDALEQALYDRQPKLTHQLIHHSNRGAQYVSIQYTKRLAEAGIEPSVGSRGTAAKCPGRDHQRAL
jgi:putative transposase